MMAQSFIILVKIVLFLMGYFSLCQNTLELVFMEQGDCLRALRISPSTGLAAFIMRNEARLVDSATSMISISQFWNYLGDEIIIESHLHHF